MSLLRISKFFPLRSSYLGFGLIACWLWIQATPSLRAQDRTDPPVIAYDPSLVQIEGRLPKIYTYSVGIKSPSNLPTSAATTITLAITPTAKPALVSDSTAAGYVTFSRATLSFSGPDQVQYVSITLSIPVNGEPGDYNYKILSEGWPVDPAFGLSNDGTFINATVTAAAVEPTPPAVAISNPGSNTTVLVQAGYLPAIVPLNFAVTSPGPSPSAIDSVTYDLDGNPQPISLSSLTGIDTYTILGSGTMSVATAGPHTVTVSGHNLGGTVSATSTFTVVVVRPPTVQIAAPLANDVVAYDASGPRPAIPFSFSANSPSSSLTAYTAQLNGSTIPLSSIVGGVGTLAMTGSAADLAGAVAGSNTLAVTATNASGTASATSTFRVNPVSIAINNPAGGSTITLPAGSLTGNIGFKFTTTAGSGFTVDSVSAKLDGSIANVAISIPGTGSSTAVSTGTLANVGAGPHTLIVTGVSVGVSVSASVNFTVVVVPPVPAIVINDPSVAVINLPVGVLTGDIPFRFTTSTLAGFKIDTVSATLDNQSVSPILSPNLGVSNSVVSTGTLVGMGAGLHTLNVMGTSGSASASTSFTFTVNVTLKANQTITFGALAAKTVGDAAFALGATASSNLAVSYTSSNSAVATVSGSTVTVVGAGSTTITASQAGNANYNAATPVAQTLTVQPGSPPSSTCGTALVRHSPELNGNAGINGSLQVLLPESMALNGNAWISESLLVPGKPTIRLNGNPTYGSVIDGTGSASPSNYIITLNGNPVVGHIVLRTNAVGIPVINTPPAPSGVRDVKLNKSSDSSGDFATLRDLTVNGDIGRVAVPPGNYRDLTANGNSGFILGVSGSTQPSVYYVRNLKLSGNGDLKIVGPVILTVTDDVTFNGKAGSSDHPEWLVLNLYSGDLTLNGTAHVYGSVLAPFGKVTLSGNSTLRGGLISDELTINGNGLLDLCSCDDSYEQDGGHHGNNDDRDGDDHEGDDHDR